MARIKMKLWYLCVTPYEPDGLPDQHYDMVVRAPDVDTARGLAAKNAQDEGVYTWLDADKSTCTELTTAGDAGVIIAG
jgi:hypothetical protein